MNVFTRHRAQLVRGFGIAAAAALFAVGCSNTAVSPDTAPATTVTDKYVAYNVDVTALAASAGTLTYDQLMTGSANDPFTLGPPDGRDGKGGEKDTVNRGGGKDPRDSSGKGPGGPGGPGGKDSLHREDTTHKGGPGDDTLHRGGGKDTVGKGGRGGDSLHREDSTHKGGGDDTLGHRGRIDDGRGGPGKGPGKGGPRDTTLGLSPRSLRGIINGLGLTPEQDAAVKACFDTYQECVMSAKHRYADARKSLQDAYQAAMDRVRSGVKGGSITPEDGRKIVDSLNKDFRAKIGILLPEYNAAVKSCTDNLYKCIESQLTADQLGRWRVIMKR
ncbi:MAG: hypothetical protein ABIR47_04965 [Candidatus Kapaibacterium sp.]